MPDFCAFCMHAHGSREEALTALCEAKLSRMPGMTDAGVSACSPDLQQAPGG